MDTRTILLDVGGSYIKRHDGPAIPIPSEGSREAISAALRKAVEMPDQVRHDGGVTPGLTGGLTRIGIAIPGPFDFKEGIFLMKHKFEAVYGERFAELAGIPEGVTVRYIHDVIAVLEGAVRMMNLYSGNTALVSLGTGLGFAVAKKGQVRYGPTGSPADVIWNRPWKDGILEDYASAKAVRNAWVAAGGSPKDSAATIALRAYEGNQAAVDAYAMIGETLGEALQGLLEEHNVDTLLFSGQVSKSLILMEDNLRKYLKGIKITLAPAGAVFEGISGLFENN